MCSLFVHIHTYIYIIYTERERERERQTFWLKSSAAPFEEHSATAPWTREEWSLRARGVDVCLSGHSSQHLAPRFAKAKSRPDRGPLPLARVAHQLGVGNMPRHRGTHGEDAPTGGLPVAGPGERGRHAVRAPRPRRRRRPEWRDRDSGRDTKKKILALRRG